MRATARNAPPNKRLQSDGAATRVPAAEPQGVRRAHSGGALLTSRTLELNFRIKNA
jgi:hypothetical protein